MFFCVAISLCCVNCLPRPKALVKDVVNRGGGLQLRGWGWEGVNFSLPTLCTPGSFPFHSSSRHFVLFYCKNIISPSLAILGSCFSHLILPRLVNLQSLLLLGSGTLFSPTNGWKCSFIAWKVCRFSSCGGCQVICSPSMLQASKTESGSLMLWLEKLSLHSFIHKQTFCYAIFISLKFSGVL